MFSTGRHCHYDIMVFHIGCRPKMLYYLVRTGLYGKMMRAKWQVLDGEPREYLVNPPPRFDTLWVVCLQLKIEHRTKCLLFCSLWRHLYLPDFALHLLFYCWLFPSCWRLARQQTAQLCPGQNPKFLPDVVFRFSTAWCHIRMLSRLITK